MDRTEAVIAALGLEKCRNTIIGGPLMRGVSGGERKRVAVGHELLIDPAVMMLDEPTRYGSQDTSVCISNSGIWLWWDSIEIWVFANLEPVCS